MKASCGFIMFVEAAKVLRLVEASFFPSGEGFIAVSVLTTEAVAISLIDFIEAEIDGYVTYLSIEKEALVR